jgi:hypothetical protein
VVSTADVVDTPTGRRVVGAAQVVAGAVTTAGGVAIGWTGVGVGVAAVGADLVQAGARQVSSGEWTPTLLAQGLDYGAAAAGVNADDRPLLVGVGTALIQGGAGYAAVGALRANSGGVMTTEAPRGAELRPYGGPGGGHHVPAKKAFEGAINYDADAALAIPNAELARLGLRHQTITTAQMRAYQSLARSGQGISWDAVEAIETQALICGGMQPGTAAATVRGAIQNLKDSGVSGPTRVPWGGR